MKGFHRKIINQLSTQKPSCYPQSSVNSAKSNCPSSYRHLSLFCSLTHCSATLIGVLMVSGCSPADTKVDASAPWQDAQDAGVVGFGDTNKIQLDGKNTTQSTQSNKTTTDKYINLSDRTVQSTAVIKAKRSISQSHSLEIENDAKAVKENLRNSYARLAAQRADVCPKLLQKNVDSNVIRRSNDLMIEDHCDYFIYPIPGQRIEVISSNDQIDTMLIAPNFHDFANGDYLATSAQKHIIRLAYDGITRKPDSMSYSVSVIVKE